MLPDLERLRHQKLVKIAKRQWKLSQGRRGRRNTPAGGGRGMSQKTSSGHGMPTTAMNNSLRLWPPAQGFHNAGPINISPQREQSLLERLASMVFEVTIYTTNERCSHHFHSAMKTVSCDNGDSGKTCPLVQQKHKPQEGNHHFPIKSCSTR